MKKLIGKRLAAAGLAVALVVSAVSVPNQASAAKAVKKVKVDKKKVTLYPKAAAGYGSIKIKASVTPKGAKAKFKWKSNKKKVATVNSKGLIKAKKAGKAVITVKAGKKKATVKVTVKKIKTKVKTVTVANKNLTLTRGQSAKLNTSVAPKKATLKKLAFTSQNKKVATVSASGVVKAVAAGNTTITVAAVDGSKKKATVAVKVTNPATTPSKQPVPSVKPSAQPSVSPSAKPSTEPSTKPSTEPSTKPSTEPSTEPSSEPSADPSANPSASPSASPSANPSAGPVEPTADPEIAGNVKYALDADTNYEAKATVLGKEITLNTTDATVALAEKAFAKVVKGFKEFYKDETTYNDKVIAPKTYTVAEGVTVTVSKAEGNVDEKWNGNLRIKLSGVSSDIDGEYLTKIFQDGDGVYNMTDVNAKYYMEGVTASWSKKFVIRFAESAPVTDAAGNQTIIYDIDELSFDSALQNENHDKLKVWAAGSDASDNIKVTVSSNADATEETITVERGSAKIVVKKAASGYTVSVPEAYVSKYGLQIASK